MAEPFKQNNSSTYIQFKDGGELYFLGNCIGIDNIPNPQGGMSLVQCRSADGMGFVVETTKREPAGTIDFTITDLVKPVASWLSKAIRTPCPVNLYVTQDCGRPGVVTSWTRVTGVLHAVITDDTLSSVQARNSQEEIGEEFAISGVPPRVDVFKPSTSRKTTSEAQALNTVVSSGAGECGGCAPYNDPCADFAAGANASGAATANVQWTTNEGTTWAAGATDPFTGNSEHVLTITSFPYGTGRRILAGRSGTAGTPLQVAYTDDFGATWTRVQVGGTNAEGFTGPKSLWAFDWQHIWAVTSAGNIFFSGNGGVTWTLQRAFGTQLNAVHSYDGVVVVAVGNGDNVLYSVDGGVNWGSASATGSGDALLSVWTFNRYRWLIGTNTAVSAQSLYMTYDGGATYETRAFAGVGDETVKDMYFYNDAVGIIISNTAGPVGSIHFTWDGGYNFTEIVAPTNSGLNSVWMCDVNTAIIVGAVNGGTAVIVHLGD